jgi:hypothetical protein
MTVLAALGACAPGPDNAVFCNAVRAGASGSEVIVDGRVARLLGTESGPNGRHEGFMLQIARPCSVTVRVESNVGYTGLIPLHAGTAAEVKGELDEDATGPVIHFTHRELRGRHPGGYVKIGGTYYW